MFILLVVLVCFFPYWFTREGDPDLCFKGTGEIGDTIGGIMGPFVAIIAAFLTFIAFLIQYDANELQKKELERQKKLHQRDSFEQKLYKMLDDYKDNARRLTAGELRGKDAVQELLGELSYIFSCVHLIMMDIAKTKQLTATSNNSGKALEYLAEMSGDPKELLKYQMLLSYYLFYFGMPYITMENLNAGKMALEIEIAERIKKIPFTKSSRSYRNYLYDEKLHTSNIPTQVNASYRLMQGHNDQLGVYFRQLYQIVIFIARADNDVFTEKDKYAYAKLLRSNMSDSEQILLFYNSLSEMGENWNQRPENAQSRREDLGLIARFKLIKNIPANFPFFGVSPAGYYNEEKEVWKEVSKEDRFFEHQTFMLNGNSVISGKFVTR